MVQIPILSGIFASSAPEFRTSYPVNYYAVPKETGISQGFLQPASGIVPFAVGPGIDRGGIEWNGTLYRVMGSSLVSVSSSGAVTTLGDVGTDGGTVTLDYDFDRLAVRSAGKLFYWNGTTLTEVTDPDLGVVNDMLWVDGYWMTTDGEFLVVTELNDPTMVDPLKYGSAEADPDPILAIRKIRNEIYAANRETIEVFDNTGGELFPFARVEGAQIEKGTLGRDCLCVFLEALAFIGSGRNEQPAVYVATNGSAQKISTHEIDLILAEFTEAQLATSFVEARNEGSHDFLYIHLPDRCLLYDAGASRDLAAPVWTVLQSGLGETGQYRGKFFVWAYNKWICSDPQQARLGALVNNISSHWGEVARWEFGTQVVYNESRGAIFHEMELVGLPGNVAFGEDPFISTSYSLDGRTWSSERTIRAGALGDRLKRLVWFGLGFMRNWRIQRFRGTTDAHIAFARLEARLEPLGN
jgi:hypothetical protein